MRQRLALAISSVVAASVLAVGLSAAGFGPNAPTVASDDDFEVAQANADDPTEDELTEAVEPEIVYVKPAPAPKTVVKVKRTKAKDGGSAKRRTSRVRAEDREDERERDDEWERKRERREDRERDDDDERDERDERDDEDD